MSPFDVRQCITSGFHQSTRPRGPGSLDALDLQGQRAETAGRLELLGTRGPDRGIVL
jgi:hypothetical protein